MHATRHDDGVEAPDASRPDGSSGRSWAVPAALGAAGVAGAVAIAVLDPTDSGAPVCLSQSALGIDCPLCGGLRCVNSLARGDLLGAADHNVLLAVALPLAALLWGVWMLTTLRGRRMRLPRLPTWLWYGVAVLLVAFTVTRNLGTDGWIGWLSSGAAPA